MAFTREEKLAKKREYNAKYRAANKDKIDEKRNSEKELLAAKQRVRYENNKDQYKASMRRYQQENKESIRKYQAAYRIENRDSISASQNAYVERNREACHARAKEWTSRNRDKKIVYAQNRRRKISGVLSSDLVSKLLRSQEAECFYCKRDLDEYGFHLDHFYPISKGGENTDENIVLACPSCNLRKGARDPHKFINELRSL